MRNIIPAGKRLCIKTLNVHLVFSARWSHPIKNWDEPRIKQTVHACILLHNMMMQEHIDNDNNKYSDDNFHGMYDHPKTAMLPMKKTMVH